MKGGFDVGRPRQGLALLVLGTAILGSSLSGGAAELLGAPSVGMRMGLKNQLKGMGLRKGGDESGAELRLRGGGLFQGKEQAAEAGNTTVTTLGADGVLHAENKTLVPATGKPFTRATSYSVLNEAVLTETMPKDDNATKADSPPRTSTTAEEAPGVDNEFVEMAEQQIQNLLSQGKDKEADRVAEALLQEGKNYSEFHRMNIVLVSSELARYAKSGGLADVTDKLSVALAKRGHRVMTIMPMYGNYDGVVCTGVNRGFGIFGGGHTITYHHKWEASGLDQWGNESGVDRIFVDHPCYKRPGMYGEWGKDYADNLFRFTLFAWAALEAPLCQPSIAPFGGEDLIFLANDWQAGLVPLIMNSHYRRHRCFNNARCIFVVHNMGYHGVYPNPPTWEEPKFSCHDMGLPDNAYYERYQHTFPIHERPSQGRDPRDDGEAIKLLRGAIEMADRVVTVAPSYKWEIMSPEGGFGLHETAGARSYHLDGILNGIDLEEWDPSKDPHIQHHYTAQNMTNKTKCKLDLQRELGLYESEHTPIVAFIGRLAPQKGIHLIQECLGWLLGGDHLDVTGDVQLVMMGSGDGEYCQFLMDAENGNKGRVCGFVGFRPEMEHKIIAGADILIMPSMYEPCGLPQMYAQRYGTIPVVHATGGLKDSVVQYDPFADGNATNSTGNETKVEDVPGKGTGWQFDAADAGGLKFGLWNALHTYKNYKDSWKRIMQRCMLTDFSWEKSAKSYEQVFEWALMDPPYINPWPF